MDVLLLGAGLIVLIAVTVWIVWWPSTESLQMEDNTGMIPQGDEFQDQYTSATADLSAGGVAVTAAGGSQSAETPAETPAETRYDTPAETRGNSQYVRTATPPPEAPQVTAQDAQVDANAGARRISRRAVRSGLAAAITLVMTGAGVWLYLRWQRERNKPLNRVRRRLRGRFG